MTKLFAAAATAGVALFVVASAQPQALPAKRVPLLGIVDDLSPHEMLVRIGPRFGRVRASRAVDLGFATYTWDFSPDRTRIAFGRKGFNDGIDLDHTESFFRVVDPKTMRATLDLPLGRGVLQSAPAWLSADRIAAVKFAPTGPGSELVVAAPSTGAVLERRELPGVLGSERRGSRFAVLTWTGAGIAPVELLVVDADGTIRTAVLERISGGKVPLAGDDPGIEEIRPGLAVAPNGRRAYVLSASGLVAAVDLDSLGITYHQVALPAAPRSKASEESLRSARVLPNGLISLTGSETHPAQEQGQTVPRRLTVGLWLIDPSKWSARRVDRYSDSIFTTGGYMLATGWHYHPAGAYATGTGLTAYSYGGTVRFRVFRGRSVDVYQHFGSHVVAFVEGHDRWSVVDLHKPHSVVNASFQTFPVVVTP